MVQTDSTAFGQTHFFSCVWFVVKIAVGMDDGAFDIRRGWFVVVVENERQKGKNVSQIHLLVFPGPFLAHMVTMGHT